MICPDSDVADTYLFFGYLASKADLINQRSSSACLPFARSTRTNLLGSPNKKKWNMLKKNSGPWIITNLTTFLLYHGWACLSALRALAPEFYDNIPSHPSLPMVIVNFIRDKEVGKFEWAKRLVNNGPARHVHLLGKTMKCSGDFSVLQGGGSGNSETESR
ncbi:hypothetical protein BYT27DRAFT_6690264 [Phlegmacium glaucopus]|nr:hypothetical protein BYT27DRAFT_6690264 [Phlegmacium glaucopus]